MTQNVSRTLPSRQWTRDSISRLLMKTLLLCLIATPFTAHVWAQATTASVLGTVTDPSGAILPGASVTLKSLDTGRLQTTVSNSAGEYSFNLIPIGRYTLAVTMASFRVFKIDEISLAAGDRSRVDANLILGDVNQTVEVTDHAASLQTDSSTVGALLDTKTVQDLPLNGRNVFNLVNLTPGVTAATAPTSAGDDHEPGCRGKSSRVRSWRCYCPRSCAGCFLHT